MKNDNLSSPWTQKEKEQWFTEQVIQRSYQNEVVTKILKLKEQYEVSTYGALSINPTKYPLYLLRSRYFDPKKKTVLITGGVHGYETSGVHGALLFVSEHAPQFEATYNFVCAPCLSPWGYETVNRWNNLAIDPNRNFYPDSPAEECRLFLKAMEPYQIFAHFDLHETPDTDNTIFRPALEKRDAIVIPFSPIPDGFYTVGSTHKPQLEFQKAVIESVRKVTHISPADEKGELLGTPIESEGIILYDMKKLFLCGGFSDAEFMTTTEVYPDSPKVTDEICNRTQVPAIVGGLDFIQRRSSLHVR